MNTHPIAWQHGDYVIRVDHAAGSVHHTISIEDLATDSMILASAESARWMVAALTAAIAELEAQDV